MLGRTIKFRSAWARQTALTVFDKLDTTGSFYCRGSHLTLTQNTYEQKKANNFLVSM